MTRGCWPGWPAAGCAPKNTELVAALNGRFDDHHGELARMLLDQIDALTRQIDKLTTRIDQLAAGRPNRRDPTADHERHRPRTDAPIELNGAAPRLKSPVSASTAPRPSWPNWDWT